MLATGHVGAPRALHARVTVHVTLALESRIWIDLGGIPHLKLCEARRRASLRNVGRAVCWQMHAALFRQVLEITVHTSLIVDATHHTIKTKLIEDQHRLALIIISSGTIWPRDVQRITQLMASQPQQRLPVQAARNIRLAKRQAFYTAIMIYVHRRLHRISPYASNPGALRSAAATSRSAVAAVAAGTRWTLLPAARKLSTSSSPSASDAPGKANT